MAVPETERASSWIVANRDLLRPGGRALDVACGTGRHALFLARRGLSVRAVDRDAARLEALAAEARRLGLPIETEVLDLEVPGATLGDGGYDAIVVVHYLHRPLFPAIVRALRPGGVLLYETFTTAQAVRGRPKNPAFLLDPGELPSLVAPLRVVRWREGEFEGRMVGSVAALRVVPGAASRPE
jgi:SAM-dependent methyltransferase